jgi:Cu/Ag efflux protein CusF
MRNFTLIAAAIAALATAPVIAQTGGAIVASQPGKVAMADTATITATVTAIDKAKRLVTLQGPEGKTKTIQVGPDVKNFDQIKVGDVVVAQYVEALTMELKKGGGQIRERIERENAVVAKPGDKPGAAAGRTVTVIADVIGVDMAKQMITVKGPQRTIDLKVRDPNQLKLIKVGDQIEATFTEAVAIAVEAAPAAAKPMTPTPAAPAAPAKK